MFFGSLLFSNFAYSQCVKNINAPEPYYKLIEPTKTFVDEVKDINPDGVAFVKLEGDQLTLLGEGGKTILKLQLKYNDMKEDTESKDIISSFTVKKSKIFYEAKVIYRLREGCYDCRVELYNKKEVLFLKFFSDKIESI